MQDKLIKILSPYDNWFNDKGEKENLKAREKLHIFYKEFTNLKPSKNYEKRDFLHTSYIRHLVLIKKAFGEEKYMRVCNELISLIYYEPFLQRRIYYNILDLLEENLNIERK